MTVAVDPLQQKLDALEDILSQMDRALIGYSGGVDSVLLAVAAHRVLGDRAIAVTADSASYAEGELEKAQEITRQFGIRHEVVRTQELDNPDYARNPTNRCYFCKQELFIHMEELAERLGASHLLYGQNADDVGDFRPGAKAARDYGVRAPLMEAGFTKADVRALARRWDIPVWDRPAMACLSSRFPYGTPITAEQLRMVDRAEAFLRDEGFAQLRVRHHTDLARIELPGPDLDRLLADPALCRRLNAQLAAIGYDRVTADLRGFRSGSMNEVLMPAAADPNAVPDRIAQLLAALPDAAAAVRREQMLVIEVGPRTGALLAQTPQRLALVEALEALGLRYIALDLAPTS